MAVELRLPMTLEPVMDVFVVYFEKSSLEPDSVKGIFLDEESAEHFVRLENNNYDLPSKHMRIVKTPLSSYQKEETWKELQSEAFQAGVNVGKMVRPTTNAFSGSIGSMASNVTGIFTANQYQAQFGVGSGLPQLNGLNP